MATGGTVGTGFAFRDELIRHGVLIEGGAAGMCAYSGAFEDTVQRIDRLVARCGSVDAPDVMRFSPLLHRSYFERSGYLESFPQLAGSVHSFTGDERAHRELIQAVQDGRNWAAHLPPTAGVLTPAACYPVYPLLSGTLPAGGRLVDVMSYCFRHEPSDDPARLQMFRMHEHVRVADAASAVAWRDRWIHRAAAITATLDLGAHLVVASDAFFGRTGMLLAENQRVQRLKLELVTPIASDERPTAIISLNYHQDHFGELFAIRTAEGTIAHSACVGFGLERMALALYRQHGANRSAWPCSAREALEL
jgi:seryl-tRNA synthetase